MTNQTQSGTYVYSYYPVKTARKGEAFFAISISSDQDLPEAIKDKSLRVEFWDTSNRILVPDVTYAEGGFIDCHLPDSRHAASLRLQNDNYLLSALDAGKILPGVNCSGDFKLNAIGLPQHHPSVYRRYAKSGVLICGPDLD